MVDTLLPLHVLATLGRYISPCLIHPAVFFNRCVCACNVFPSLCVCGCACACACVKSVQTAEGQTSRVTVHKRPWVTQQALGVTDCVCVRVCVYTREVQVSVVCVCVFVCVCVTVKRNDHMTSRWRAVSLPPSLFSLYPETAAKSCIFHLRGRRLDEDLRLDTLGVAVPAAPAVADVGVGLGVLVPLLPEPGQVAAVAQQVEGQAEAQQAQAQQPHVDLRAEDTLIQRGSPCVGQTANAIIVVIECVFRAFECSSDPPE